MNEDTQPRKIGSLRRGWMITKSTWRIMSLDKEILWVPLISGLTGIVVAVLGYGLGYGLANNRDLGSLTNTNTFQPSSWSYVAWIITSALLAILSTYTLAAMTAISLKRLRGGDPTLSDGWSVIKRQFKALTIFSLFSFGIIQLLQFLQSRLPFAGKILAFLGQVAWRVAAFFAIPIIADSDENLGPIDATKKSLNLIKQTWRESSVNQFVMGSVFAIILVLETVVGIGSTVLTGNAFGAFAVIPAIAMFLVIILTILVSSAMDGIAKAVLYYYAVTGEAPAQFDKRLIQEAFTPKKARKLFSL